MIRSCSGPLLGALTIAALTVLSVPQARAQFSLDGGTGFAVLYEGAGGNQLQLNNGGGPGNENVNGNIGIGATGTVAITGPDTINGSIYFSAPNTSQCSGCATAGNITLNGTVNFNASAVTTALTNLNTLSQNLSTETGTAVAINSGGSLNASSGALIGGNEVFTASSVSFPNGTFTINGTSSQWVVINVPLTGGVAFNGSIVLSGGITSDHVLINIDSGNYATLSGGSTLTISTNGATTTGTFLVPNADFQVNHSILDGRLFGGDTHNSTIVSGGDVIAPASTPVPEPSSLILLGSGLAGLWLGLRFRRQSRRPSAAPLAIRT